MMTTATPTPTDEAQPQGYRCLACNRWIDSDAASAGHCPCCGADNRTWRELRTLDHLRNFPLWVWALLGLLLVLGSAAAILLNPLWKPEPAHRPAQIRLVSLAVITIAVVFFCCRQHLHNYELLRQVLPSRRRLSLVWLAVLSLIVATLLAVGGAALLWWSTAESLTLSSVRDQSYLPWLLYICLVPATAVAIMLLGTRSYSQKLDKVFDRPIFCDHDKLYSVVWNSLTQTYLTQRDTSAARSADGSPAAPTAPDILERTSSVRNRHGGLDMTIRHRFGVPTRNTQSLEYEIAFEDHSYQAATDKWGQILTFEEQVQPAANEPTKS